mgnify:FL=1
MDSSKLIDCLDRFAGLRVLVIGDVVLDRYIVGRAERLSREAPVPIVEFDREFSLPGAAANPANNVQSLGGKALIVGIVGDDLAGKILRQQLDSAGIDTRGLIVDPPRPTTTKTRVLAEDRTRIRQQVVRIDHVDRRAIDSATLAKAVDYIDSIVGDVDAVLVSDYKNGLVGQALVQTCLERVRHYNKILTADSQGDLHKFKGFTLVKCNQQEAEATLGSFLRTDAQFASATGRLLKRLQAEHIVVTRGGDGMSVASAEGYAHIPVANRSEVFDVTGAGDTVIAVLTLGLAAGASLFDAAHLSNFAAGLVVRRLGNATTNREELSDFIRHWEQRAISQRTPDHR